MRRDLGQRALEIRNPGRLCHKGIHQRTPSPEGHSLAVPPEVDTPHRCRRKLGDAHEEGERMGLKGPLLGSDAMPEGCWKVDVGLELARAALVDAAKDVMAVG